MAIVPSRSACRAMVLIGVFASLCRAERLPADDPVIHSTGMTKGSSLLQRDHFTERIVAPHTTAEPKDGKDPDADEDTDDTKGGKDDPDSDNDNDDTDGGEDDPDEVKEPDGGFSGGCVTEEVMEDQSFCKQMSACTAPWVGDNCKSVQPTYEMCIQWGRCDFNRDNGIGYVHWDEASQVCEGWIVRSCASPDKVCPEAKKKDDAADVCLPPTSTAPPTTPAPQSEGCVVPPRAPRELIASTGPTEHLADNCPDTKFRSIFQDSFEECIQWGMCTGIYYVHWDAQAHDCTGFRTRPCREGDPAEHMCPDTSDVTCGMP